MDRRTLEVKIASFGNLFGEIGRCQEARLLEKEIVSRRTIAARLFHHFVDAAKSLRDEKTGLRALFFKQSVRADGRAMTEERNVACGHALTHQFFDAMQNRLKRLFRCS